MINILQSFFQNDIDQPANAWFLANRTDFGEAIFSIITFFGNWQFLLPVIAVIIWVLFKKNRKEFIIPFGLTILGAETVTFLGKMMFHRSRPLFAVFHETDFSFPSGHATIAVAFYGYLAYILARSAKKRYRWLIISGAILIAGLIGYSRLYLGVHYVSDILAGYLIGSTALIIGTNLRINLKK